MEREPQDRPPARSEVAAVAAPGSPNMTTLLLALILCNAPLGPLDPGSGGARDAFERGFLENGGQWPAEARFRTGSGGRSAWFVERGWWLVLRGETGGARVRMSFEGARPSRPRPDGELPARHHVYRGSAPERWATNLAAFERLRWEELYEGIDVLARGPRDPAGAAAALFEYDLELSAGADLARVELRVAGHTGLSVEPDGSLAIATAAGVLRQSPPIAWQYTESGPAAFECRFRLNGPDSFGFDAPDRDRSLPAVVDPALVFSTYFSGAGAQAIEQVELAPNGDVLVAGTTDSDAFPTTPGAFEEFAAGLEDVFVARFAPDGTLLWSSYLNGTDSDLLGGLALDAGGAPTLCGTTRSTDFPATPGAFDTGHNGFLDGFCAQLAPSGDALRFSTFLGGGLNDRAADLALDGSDAVTVVGSTNGSGFPVVGGSYDTSFNGGVFAGDAFCLRLDPTGSQLVWSTYFGGSSDDGATAVAVETTGEVTVAGVSSGAFAMSPGAFDPTFAAPGDAWVLRLDAAGQQRVYSTWLGGAGLEEVRRVLVDGSGASLLAGVTEGADFPVTAGAFDAVFGGATEGFVLELDAAGSALNWATFVGGAEDDSVEGLAFDPSVPPGSPARLVVATTSTSDDLQATPGAYDGDFNASLFGLFPDVHLYRLTLPVGPGAPAVDYATYFGTTDDELVGDIAVDAAGAVVIAGATSSFGFPTTAGAQQPGFNAAATREGFLSKLALLRHPIRYGLGTPPGAGGTAIISWEGFPDLASDDFALIVDNGAPNQKAILFHGFAPQASPFYGGTIYVKPPLKRHRPVKTDSFGYKLSKLDIEPGWVGQTLYFQWWIKDPPLKKKTGLSNGLEILFYP